METKGLMITRREARMIAKEVMALMIEGGYVEKPLPKYVGAKEAAEYMCIPLNTLYKKIEQIPHEKRGKRLVFEMQSLRSYMNNE